MIKFTRSSEPVLVSSGKVHLAGVLEFPPSPGGMVLLPHDGSSHHLSPRSNYLAEELRRAGLATLLIDLVGLEEEDQAKQTSDLALLNARLAAVTDWIGAEPEPGRLPLGLFGAALGAAAALKLAASRPERIAAVVARAGRPDLAGTDVLARVRAPTLLIVGEADHASIEFNRRALEQLGCEKDLAVIRGLVYPDESRHALQEIARLAARWFKGYFGGDTRPTRALAS